MLYSADCPPGPGENNNVDVDEGMTSCDVEHTSDDDVSVSVSVSVSHDHVEPIVDSAHTEQDFHSAHTEQDFSSAHTQQDSLSACTEQDFLLLGLSLMLPLLITSKKLLLTLYVVHGTYLTLSTLIIQLHNLDLDDLLLKYPYLSESLSEWSDDPNEN